MRRIRSRGKATRSMSCRTSATSPWSAPHALDALETYRWPGNVRELQNVIERACALADGASVKRRNLPEYLLRAPDAAVPNGAPGDRSTAQRGQRAVDGGP